ncbi:SCO3374 family protein [Streptomyces naphthomycinicus]|uniref:SCO3374 family protein n=1 Tax=Streptomyces naphthomycinicus TaxID=2872625 RepID=UPI001CEDA1DA|nr:SCO3374 family protein [Streptomyces sp. TML10]
MVGPVLTTSTVPLPRRPPGPDAPAADGFSADPDTRARRWYENDLGWPTVPGRPLRLPTGVRFDVLDVPAEAGAAALRHLAPGSPVALRGDRMELLVAAGSAEELPGLLDWLEWGSVPLDLRALGEGGTLEAPLPPTEAAAALGLESARSESVRSESARFESARSESARSRSGDGKWVQGAAVWLRPPGPGRAVEDSLPAMPAMPVVPAAPAVGREGSVPDLVRLVDTVAAWCHRVRLRRACAGNPAERRNQPLAFS